MVETETLNTLPLKAMHEAAGARFGAFAGWEMPISYPPGVMKEHLHTRAAAGLFDISHMQLFSVEGPGAAAMLARACPLDAAGLGEGRSKYTFVLNDEAGIIDDLIVTRLGGERFLVVANAANAATDAAHFAEIAAGFDCTVKPLEGVFLALQGPEAERVLHNAGLDPRAPVFMTGSEPEPGWFVSRSGYTGEDGFEIALPPTEAPAFAERLLADDRVMWAGLAARDSLRLEAGLCLHGQDLDETIDPATANLMWAIPKPLRETGDFIGAEALRAIIGRGPRQRRVGLKPEGRRPVRAGAELRDADGKAVGRVTSGGFGPSVGHPVAMGYVAPGLAAVGTPLLAEVRGENLPLKVHALPFMQHRYRKG